MKIKIDERFVIQYQYLQHIDWYDDPAFPRTFVLGEAQSLLEKDYSVQRAQEAGVRYRIAKRTVYEEAAEESEMGDKPVKVFCNCEDWGEGIRQLEGFTVLAHYKGLPYTAKIFKWCPWCGRRLVARKGS